MALRTDSGTLKASDAQNDDDLTTFAQTKTQISDAKNEMTAKLKEAKNELTHQFNTKIEELIDNAPDALNTLKELADALTENKDGITAINIALANRYTKQETDEKIKNTVEGAFSGDNDILLKKVNEKFIELYQKGYLQMPGMPSPLEDVSMHYEGYSWHEVNYDGNFFRSKGRNAKAFSAKKMTKEQIRNGNYIFQDDEQGDAIRDIPGGNRQACGYTSKADCFGAVEVIDIAAGNYYTNSKSGKNGWQLNLSNVVPIAEENRPRNLTFIYWVLVKNE
ncbi:hypothetical protein E4N84_00975 [Treponema denticola]|nr:hypothetical protein E4N84_00975 [Treponema denticola]